MCVARGGVERERERERDRQTDKIRAYVDAREAARLEWVLEACDLCKDIRLWPQGIHTQVGACL